MNYIKSINIVYSIILLIMLTGFRCGEAGPLAVFSNQSYPAGFIPKNLNASTKYYSEGIILVADSGYIYFRDDWHVFQTLFTVPGNPDLFDIAPASPVPVDFPDIRIITGANGTIVRNTVQNREWILIQSPVEESLNRIDYCYLDGIVTLYAAGNNGTILRSDDLGLSWESLPFPLTDHLYDIHLSATNLNSVFFTDENTGTAVGEYGIVLRTTNGGNTWVQQNSGLFDDLNSVYFTSSQSGIAAGYRGTILKTSDGGENWETIFSGLSTFNYNDLHFSDSNTGWAVGSSGTIFKTTDGGTIWIGQESNTEQLLNSVHFINSNTGFVVGAVGNVLRTIDGGETWLHQISNTNNTLQSVFFIDADTGIAVGDFGTIRRTTDGGNTWVPRSAGRIENLYSVFFVDSVYGKIVGDDGLILSTNDAGNTWWQENSGTTTRLREVHLTQRNAGAAVGRVGSVVRMSPAFSGWSPARPMGCNRIQVTGDNYGLYTTVNPAVEWLDITNSPVGVSKNIATGNSYNKINFYDDTLGFAAGSLGLISKTTDGGRTWISDGFADGMGEIHDLHFISPDSGVIVGANGYARFTIDGGVTWFEEQAVTEHLEGRNVNRIVPLSPAHAFIIGEELEIFIAADSSYMDSVFVITSIKEENLLIDNFSLHQNYPNPFNPATIIEFRIPVPGHVTLKVYDTAGREVAILVNEIKPAGLHSVVFDASGLSSGVYFYRLEMNPPPGSDRAANGTLTESRKLVYIK